MLKSILAGVGLIAVIAIAYHLASNKDGDVSSAAAQTVQGAANLASGKQSAGTPAAQPAAQPSDSGLKEEAGVEGQIRTVAQLRSISPKFWTTEEKMADDEHTKLFFQLALEEAEHNYKKVRAAHAQLMVKQREFLAKNGAKAKEAKGLIAQFEAARKAYTDAEARYKDRPNDWVAAFPYENSRTPKAKMQDYVRRTGDKAKKAKKYSDNFAVLSEKYERAVKVAENKKFKLEGSINDIKNSIEGFEANRALADIRDVLGEVTSNLDSISTIMEIDEDERGLLNDAEGRAIMAEDSDDFEKLMSEGL